MLSFLEELITAREATISNSKLFNGSASKFEQKLSKHLKFTQNILIQHLKDLHISAINFLKIVDVPFFSVLIPIYERNKLVEQLFSFQMIILFTNSGKVLSPNVFGRLQSGL